MTKMNCFFIVKNLEMTKKLINCINQYDDTETETEIETEYEYD